MAIPFRHALLLATLHFTLTVGAPVSKISTKHEGIMSPLAGISPTSEMEDTWSEAPERPFENLERPMERNAIRDPKKHWKGGIVPYIIDDVFPESAKATILEALNEIELDVESNGTKCIQFLPRTTETNYVNFTRGSGCHSPIGNDPKFDEVVVSTLGPGCELKGIVMHEVLHVLGFFHEHNRPDRDDYIDLNETNMNMALYRDFYIRNDTVLDTLGFPYDLRSIMHYAAFSNGVDRTYPVLTPKPQYAKGLRMGQRYALSTLDVLKIQRLYGCAEDTTHIHSDLDDGVIYSCDFENGDCGLSYYYTVVQPQDEADAGVHVNRSDYSQVRWVVRSEETQDGPRRGYTNGLDPFFYASKGESQHSEALPMNLANTSTPTEPTPILSSSVLVVTSVVTPLLTTGDSGRVCVGVMAVMRGPSSYLSLYLLASGQHRQVLRVYSGGRVDHWARDNFEINLGVKTTFRIELEATLAEGGIGVDDFFVYREKCIYIMG